MLVVIATAIMSGQATAWDLTLIDVPGSTATGATGINNSGQIEGWYSNGGATQGFLTDATSYGTFTYPGAILTMPLGISNTGQIVGYYSDSTGTYGFLKDGATFTQIALPAQSGP